jgi:general secretion pathway protein E/type IV pilus assembly protein PilB
MDDLAEKLVRKGLIGAEDAAFVRASAEAGTPVEEALGGLEGLGEERLLPFLAGEYGVPFLDIDGMQPDRDFLSAFPARVLIVHHLLPLREEEGAVLVATSRLFDAAGIDELRVVTGRDCRPALALRSQIDRSLKQLLGVGADTVQTLVSETGDEVQVLHGEAEEGLDLTQAAEDASIIRFVNEVLIEAISLRATDVHFESFENDMRVRYRVDGVLQEAAIPGEVRRFRAAIVSRLKILSRLDISEKRLPQDGRIKLRVAGRDIDVRASVIPMLHGEAVVLRLLDRSAALLGLVQLGMSEEDCAEFQQILRLPHGIVLVTGPTGSGKTTTLYAALSRINDVSRKIVTIEDPVEYQLRGINQIQVANKAGLTFATGLRSILRHDPDVILVGEIRDLQTAEIAVQASLTGHLVFSTLHTNDAPGALTRLVDMGVEPYLVASSLEAVIAQRLVRLICPECRTRLVAAEQKRVLREYGLRDVEALYYGRGCRACQDTGYRGRTGVFEMMLMSEEVRNLTLQRQSTSAVRRAAQERGMKSLREDGWRLVLEGRTTVEELLRVTKDERLINGNGAALPKEGERGPQGPEAT